ncbi:hypothetical protein HG535_0E01070 [Zygotorulaspora mrakii]|uniref:Kel1p n=1 Tax=Zygotorulaspora mrakii TaxID=42260 RepID=A0A7H9B3F5_ZYGMR|nr:uncharacterized protein HG535_0E01070 [Zygotorulaspora mrakii]QLG73023.1 hypothetical protein HG535_0E01070 [Zygotorulaspora mrakii]
MAPFNFKKKLGSKEKKSPSSSSTSPSLTSNAPKDTNGSPFQTYLEKQQQQQQQPHKHLNQMAVPRQPEPEIERRERIQHQQYQHQQQNQYPSTRVYPTPPPAQQRNVSGASTNLAQNRREYTPWNRIKLQNSPFPRYRHVASSYISDDNRVYVMGGLHDESVYGDTWIITANENGTAFTTKTVDISDSTPPPRVGHAATLCGNAFVLFGGDTHKVNSEGLMDDDIYLFNINSYKWTIPNPIGPRPLGRYGHKISIIATNQMKTKLYLFGGQFDDAYFNDLAVYDLSSFRRPDSHWDFLKPRTFVPPPLTNHTMVSYENKLWVFGGDTLQGLIDQVFMYDTATNDWSLVETTGTKPPPLQEHAALIYKDLMCVVGGKDDQDVYMNHVFFLNLKSLKWFKFPTFKAGIPQGRSGHSVSLLRNDQLLIMGGDKFDYAREAEYDLSTSDTDLGKGTILYTLDLSRLEDVCPKIFETTEPVTSFNPTTPPTNNSGAQMSNVKQPEPILTPYSNEALRTPIISKDVATNIETPQNHSTESSKTIEEIRRPSDIQRADSVVTPKAENVKKPVSPVPALVMEKIESVLETPRVVSLSSENNHSGLENTNTEEEEEEEVGSATVARSPVKGDVKYDSPNLHTTQNFLHDSEELVRIVKPSHSDTTFFDASQTEKTNDSKDTVNADIVKQLRSELENLKLETEKTAAEAGQYIRTLEEKVERLTSGLPSDPHDADVLKLQTRIHDMTSEYTKLTGRIFELESLVNAKFLDADALNQIIKDQSSKLEELEGDISLRDEFEELKGKNEAASKENEILKARLEEMKAGFKSDVSNCSKQLDVLISRWKIDSARNMDHHDEETNTHEKGSTILPFGNDFTHQKALKSVQETLDKTLEDFKELRESNLKLGSKHENLKKSYDVLAKEYQEKKEELENNYNETVNSSTNSTKALEMSQMELEKYQKENKKLREELEELRYTQDLSNGDVSISSANGNMSNSSTNLTGGQPDLNLKFNRFNMKINDLKAELYIMRQERDNLKKEVLDLKKKQFLHEE